MGLAAKHTACAWLMALCLHGLARADADAIHVAARQHGETVLIDARYIVPARIEAVWQVLTDFDHIAQFVSTVQSSKVVPNDSGKLQVAQKGKAARGPLSFTFESVQEFDLTPYREIRSRLVSGTMKKLDGVTELVARGDETEVVYRGESIPGVWVPPLIGVRFVEAGLRTQYWEVRDEIIRRQRAQSN